MKHEINLVNTVSKLLKQNHAKRILIAVSGGIDSMVLVDVVKKIYPKENIGVINVDHDLRPESASEVEFVCKYCQQNNLKFFTTKWQHHSQDVGMEAAARDFRYGFFRKIMKEKKYDTLLTAHHANDLSENILMKLVRSGNVYEVTSLKNRRDFGNGQLLRPLLTFSKEDLKMYAVKNSIEHIQDETNFENVTMRNRLRNEIFPRLQKENGQLLKHFELFNVQLDALIKLSQSKFAEIEDQMKLLADSVSLSGNLLPVYQLDADQQTLFWGSLFTKKLPQLSVSNKQISQIIEVVEGDHPNASINLESGYKFIRSYQSFKVSKLSKSQFWVETIEPSKTYSFHNLSFRIEETDSAHATFFVSHRPTKISLRTRKNGDKLVIGEGQHQKLSKRFINKKIPESKRNSLPLLLFDEQIVWVEKIYQISDYLKQGTIFYKIDFNNEV